MGLTIEQRNNLDASRIIYARQDLTPMPSREELTSRNSFGSVNDNRHINQMLRGKTQMTNNEYEKACVNAVEHVGERFEGDHQLRQYAKIIAQAEATVARLKEAEAKLKVQYRRG